jgi:TonB family protein
MYNYKPNEMLATIITGLLLFVGVYSADGQPRADAGPALSETPLEIVEDLPPMTEPPTYDGEFRSLEDALQERIEVPAITPRDFPMSNVVVRFTIDTNGDVQNPRAIKGPDFGLHETAEQAVEQLDFDPASRRGRGVPLTVDLPIDFEM